jgi:hypothetical protein
MLGWQACGSVITHVLPAHHFAFIDAPPALLDILVSSLRTIATTVPTGRV